MLTAVPCVCPRPPARPPAKPPPRPPPRPPAPAPARAAPPARARAAGRARRRRREVVRDAKVERVAGRRHRVEPMEVLRRARQVGKRVVRKQRRRRRTDAVGGNLVVRERLPGYRIDKRRREGGEVSRAQRRTRY